MLLHTVSKSPDSSDALQSCLRVALPGSYLLLIEDGVYAAARGSLGNALLSPEKLPDAMRVFALAEDLAARGLSDRIATGIETVDYPGFVELSASCHAVKSWY